MTNARLLPTVSTPPLRFSFADQPVRPKIISAGRVFSEKPITLIIDPGTKILQGPTDVPGIIDFEGDINRTSTVFDVLENRLYVLIEPLETGANGTVAIVEITVVPFTFSDYWSNQNIEPERFTFSYQPPRVELAAASQATTVAVAVAVGSSFASTALTASSVSAATSLATSAASSGASSVSSVAVGGSLSNALDMVQFSQVFYFSAKLQSEGELKNESCVDAPFKILRTRL